MGSCEGEDPQQSTQLVSLETVIRMILPVVGTPELFGNIATNSQSQTRIVKTTKRSKPIYCTTDTTTVMSSGLPPRYCLRYLKRTSRNQDVNNNNNTLVQRSKKLTSGYEA